MFSLKCSLTLVSLPVASSSVPHYQQENDFGSERGPALSINLSNNFNKSSNPKQDTSAIYGAKLLSASSASTATLNPRKTRERDGRARVANEADNALDETAEERRGGCGWKGRDGRGGENGGETEQSGCGVIAKHPGKRRGVGRRKRSGERAERRVRSERATEGAARTGEGMGGEGEDAPLPPKKEKKPQKKRTDILPTRDVPKRPQVELALLSTTLLTPALRLPPRPKHILAPLPARALRGAAPPRLALARTTPRVGDTPNADLVGDASPYSDRNSTPSPYSDLAWLGLGGGSERVELENRPRGGRSKASPAVTDAAEVLRRASKRPAALALWGGAVGRRVDSWLGGWDEDDVEFCDVPPEDLRGKREGVDSAQASVNQPYAPERKQKRRKQSTPDESMMIQINP
ncbi:hypothetical protein C8J57DRAFT_1222760 [Mycena rebaudengoi]|nr:hypothetical protein C8J57DRAFT_1222760 [Mycena rebaudengoi]